MKAKPTSDAGDVLLAALGLVADWEPEPGTGWNPVTTPPVETLELSELDLPDSVLAVLRAHELDFVTEVLEYDRYQLEEAFGLELVLELQTAMRRAGVKGFTRLRLKVIGSQHHPWEPIPRRAPKRDQEGRAK